LHDGHDSILTVARDGQHIPFSEPGRIISIKKQKKFVLILEEKMVTNMDTNTNDRPRSQHKGLVGGAILILLGLVTLLNQLGFMQFEAYFIGVLGAIFILAAFLNRKSGLLVPGGILLGINAGAVLEGFRPAGTDDAGVFLLAFAGGWLLITLLSVALNMVDSSCKMMLWPLIPGGIIGIVGGLLMMGASGLYLLSQLSLVWPVVLILLGLWIIFRRK
jgi:hypothetical protein